MKTTSFSLLLSLFSLGTPIAVFAVDRLVPSAYSTIQSAINAAGADDTITISVGSNAGAIHYVAPPAGNQRILPSRHLRRIECTSFDQVLIGRLTRKLL